MIKNCIISFLAITIMATFTSCRDDIVITSSSEEEVTQPQETGISGFYLLNEGNMGSNKCTLDYFNEKKGIYISNIYAERNPSAVKELGDVGNDINIYGNRLYAVINCSHKVEVMQAHNAKRISHINIPNCRYVKGYKNHIYVSSYVGGTTLDPKAPKGMVYKIDTLSLAIVAKVEVGYQPEEMAIVDNRLYVANSGGYRAPNYDNTISVINLDNFTIDSTIKVADNLHHIKADNNGKLWVNNRSDKFNNLSALHIVDTRNNYHVTTIDIPVDNMTLVGDSLYILGAKRNDAGKNIVQYSIINTSSQIVVNNNFITDGTSSKMKVPYGIAVHPITKDIYITDAKNYVSSGTLYCFNKDGHLKWSHTASNIPAHFTFLK